MVVGIGIGRELIIPSFLRLLRLMSFCRFLAILWSRLLKRALAFPTSKQRLLETSFIISPFISLLFELSLILLFTFHFSTSISYSLNPSLPLLPPTPSVQFKSFPSPQETCSQTTRNKKPQTKNPKKKKATHHSQSPPQHTPSQT